MGDLAKDLWTARCDGTRLSRARFDGIAGREAAYRVQAEAADISGLHRIGWKIAATSPKAQELIGVSDPAMGPVFAEHLCEAPAIVTAEVEHGAAVECEIAFTMGRPVTEPGAGRDEVLAATRQAQTAVEIVGCRLEGGFAGAGDVAMICDFAFNGALATGPVIENWRSIDFAEATARVVVNDEVKAEGSGAAVLGDPVQALVWAANEAIRIGKPLKAGDIVSTGTMTGLTPVKPGDRMVGDFGRLGKIDVRFG